MRYNAQKGKRIKGRFLGLTSLDKGWWYNVDLKTWEYNPNMEHYHYSSSQFCRTIRSFRRKLKQMKDMKGVSFVLTSKFVGYDATAKVK